MRLLKGRELLGLPIIEMKNGKEIGKVEEVIADYTNCTVFGLILEKKSWFKEPKVITFNSISNIGDSAIIINEYSENDFVNLQEKFTEIEKVKQKMLGAEVISVEGKRLGIIEDIIVDTKNGDIKGFELSDGLIGDIISGRSYIPIPNNFQAGENKIIVSSEFEGKMRDNPDDIQSS